MPTDEWVFTQKLLDNVFFKTRKEKKNGDFFCGEGVILDILLTTLSVLSCQVFDSLVFVVPVLTR